MSGTSENALRELSVRIEKLEAMRVARFHAYGPNPETRAWTELRKWAEPQGLLKKDSAAHPVFGFNNPSPSSALADYGYEFWIRIDAEMPVAGSLETITFPGGWYAVITHSGLPNPDIWKRFGDWIRGSPHSLRHTHELEHPRDPLASESDMVFDLFLPIDPAVATSPTAINVRGADFVMYPVSSLARAAHFYRETLGLPQEMYNEEWQWAEFNCGNVTLALKGGEELPQRVAGGRIALAVDNVESACAELKRLGAHVMGDPVDYGVCCAVEVLDPDGNTVILHKRADGTFGTTGN